MVRRRTLATIAVLGAVKVTALVCVVRLVRPRYLAWRVTGDEVREPLPGDELVPMPHLAATRAIDITASADQVWPWIAQMGQGRGGLYSYDALENLIGCDMHSADSIVAEWQDVAVGDDFRLHPEVALQVAVVEPGRALVVRGGVGIDDNPPPFDFAWAFVLEERQDGATRLVVRERYAYTRRWSALMVEPVEAVSFVMSQKMVRGIRDRAEGRVGGEGGVGRSEHRPAVGEGLT